MLCKNLLLNDINYGYSYVQYYFYDNYGYSYIQYYFYDEIFICVFSYFFEIDNIFSYVICWNRQVYLWSFKFFNYVGIFVIIKC